MRTIPYPPSPKADAEALRAYSPAYKKQEVKVLLSIVLFIATYLLVLAVSVAAFLFSFVVAGAVIMSVKHWIGFVIAGGLLITTGMVLFFMIKFLFQNKKDEDESRVEIFEKDQPELFEFVRRVCDETNATFPKRIVVSPHVNACVYYDSSFLSLFLPVRKNLEIGMGLMNCINITEFKAILAHEFGHFSQSSTRLGTYTYRFNKVVHNLLYENEGWSNTLTSITSIHGLLVIFGHITVWLVKGAMSLFTGAYKITHLSYMALSREMEFQADSVAVSVTGSRPIISALYRLEFGQEAYNYTLRRIAALQGEKLNVPKNFFSLQKRNLLELVKENDIHLEHGLPIITTEHVEKNSLPSRLQYTDVWASHPTTKEREANAFKIKIDSEVLHESPWELFRSPEVLQEQLSRKVPELQHPDKSPEIIDNAILLEQILKQETDGHVDPIYNGYYAYATNGFTLAETTEPSELKSKTVKDLFNSETITQLKRYYKDFDDVEKLRLISGGHLQVKRFIFDSQSYTRYYSNELYEKLKADVEKQRLSLEDHNKRISTWFYLQASDKNPELGNSYAALLKFNEQFQKLETSVTKLINELITLYHEKISKYGESADRKVQANNILEIYRGYVKVKDEIPTPEIPKMLIDAEIFESSHPAALFTQVVRQPIYDENLGGFNPLYEDLTAFAESLKIKTALLQKQVMMVQGEILKG